MASIYEHDQIFHSLEGLDVHGHTKISSVYNFRFLTGAAGGGGGGMRVTPLYELYRWVRPKGYFFLAVLITKRVSIWPFWSYVNRVWFWYSGLELGMFF